MRRDRSHPWARRLVATLADPARESLTPQEARVLTAYSVGMDGPDVAEVLGLSANTVATHTKHARQKLQAKNTTHAVANALRMGVIV